MYVCMYLCMHVCLYVYFRVKEREQETDTKKEKESTHTHANTRTHTHHTHTYIHTFSSLSSSHVSYVFTIQFASLCDELIKRISCPTPSLSFSLFVRVRRNGAIHSNRRFSLINGSKTTACKHVYVRVNAFAHALYFLWSLIRDRHMNHIEYKKYTYTYILT